MGYPKRTTVTISLATVYCKTEAGLDEMQRRTAGLNPRVRQLLILVDGKRSVAELNRMIGAPDADEFFSLLELKGLIEPVVESPLLAIAPLQTEPAGPDLEQFAAALTPPDPLDPACDPRVLRNREQLARLLSEVVGPMGEPLCGRIVRARHDEELSQLFGVALTVVELMSGRKAVDRFQEKLQATGWEQH